MSKFNIKIANAVFEINSIHDSSHTFFKDYLSKETATNIINVKDEDIEFERKERNKFVQAFNIQNSTISDEELENYSIYRTIGNYFMDKHVLFFHGAAVVKEKNAYMFIAPSGVGKTTHVLNWIKQYPDAYIINGDMPLLLIDKDMICVTGSPWSGKEGLNTNAIAPLKAICLFNRGEANTIIKLEDTDLIFEKLYGHVFKRNDQSLSIIKDIKTIIDNVDMYKMHANQDIESSVVAYNKMSKKH